MRPNEETKSTFEQRKQNDNEVLMKRSTVSLQKGLHTLARPGTVNFSPLIGVLLLSLLLFHAPVARAQLAQSIVLTGGSGWNTMPFAYYDPSGFFQSSNASVTTQFGTWAATAGVQVLVGDFKGDGLSDIALVGIPGADFVPIAIPNSNDGTYAIGFYYVGNNFTSWAATSGVRALVGDFNGDGHADIALVGGAGWNTVPIAFWNQSNFKVTNLNVGAFGSWAASSGVHVLVADFNGDGKSDIALVGGAGWASVPVAFSNGDGTFKITNAAVTNSSPGDFARMATAPGVQVLVGDFNGDGKSDIALVGGAGWASVPVAFSNGDGTFNVTNKTAPGGFATLAAENGVRALVGNFTNTSLSDIALVGGSGWNTLPVAYSNGDGAFTVLNNDVGAWFQASAAEPGVQVLVGDFNRDGLADIALVGGAGWNTVPVAFGLGACGQFCGGFKAVNAPAGNFAGWAAQPGVKALAAQVFHQPTADLAIQQSGLIQPTPVLYTTFGYLVQVINSGPEDADNVVLNSRVPFDVQKSNNVQGWFSNAVFPNSSGYPPPTFPISCQVGTITIQCNLGLIPKGSTAVVEIFAWPPDEPYPYYSLDWSSGDSVTTTATVSSSTFDPNPRNNSSTLNMTVQ